jgi:hypothetical protein
MKTKRLFRSRKGFSAIIASLILMLLAVAAGVVVYGYVMGWIGGATTNPRMTGHLSFDMTSASVATNNITLAIRNVGGTSVVLANVYVQGVDRTNYCSVNGNATVLNLTGYPLLVQQVANMTIIYQGTMSTGSYYTVQVACKDGTVISQAVPAQ